MKTKVSII